jgi:hypothetical protein
VDTTYRIHAFTACSRHHWSDGAPSSPIELWASGTPSETGGRTTRALSWQGTFDAALVKAEVAEWGEVIRRDATRVLRHDELGLQRRHPAMASCHQPRGLNSGKLRVRDDDAGLVGIRIDLGANLEAGFGGGRCDQLGERFKLSMSMLQLTNRTQIGNTTKLQVM